MPTHTETHKSNVRACVEWQGHVSSLPFAILGWEGEKGGGNGRIGTRQGAKGVVSLSACG